MQGGRNNRPRWTTLLKTTMRPCCAKGKPVVHKPRDFPGDAGRMR